MTDVPYLTDLLERTEQDMAYYHHELITTPSTVEYLETIEILHDGYMAAKNRHAKIIALLEPKY